MANFMFLIPCVFLQLIQQQTNALDKIQFTMSIKLLHVSAPGAILREFLEPRKTSPAR